VFQDGQAHEKGESVELDAMVCRLVERFLLLSGSSRERAD
jgi:hypothetical protein